MAKPILIWGAGAIGGILGAYWARAGHNVQMVDISEEHAIACSTKGLSIKGPVEEFTQFVQTCTPQQLEGQWPIVVLAVKAHHTIGAVKQLSSHLTKDGYVLSAQNGLNELAISKHLSEEQTMGSFVNYGADWHGPGDILYGNRGAVVVGEIDGSTRNRTREMHELLQIFEPDAILTDNIWGYLWGKLGYGSLLFGTALTHDSMTENFADPQRTKVWLTLGREVMSVAREMKVDPIGFNGFDPDAFMPGADEQPALDSIKALAEFNSKTAKTHTGIWRDLAVRKRKTEVDAQIGIIVELAEDKQIKTPALRRMVELIHDIEDGKREQSAETLQELAKICT